MWPRQKGRLRRDSKGVSDGVDWQYIVLTVEIAEIFQILPSSSSLSCWLRRNEWISVVLLMVALPPLSLTKLVNLDPDVLSLGRARREVS